MKKTVFIIMLMFFTSTIFNQSVKAQSTDRATAYLNSLPSISELFMKLVTGVERIATYQDKQKFKAFANKFDNNIRDLIKAKKEYIILLKDHTKTNSQLITAIGPMETDLEKLRKTLKDHLELINALNINNLHANDTYDDLDTDLFVKNNLINDLPAEISTQNARRQKAINTLETAINYLKDARKQLGLFLDKLN